MATLNKVQLIGNLGRDPELRYTSTGTPVCTISLATTNAYKDKTSGDRIEESEWHRVVFFDKLAEIVGEHMKKGRPLYVEGRLRTRKWQDKDNRDVYTTEIIGTEMQMLGSKPNDEKAATQRESTQAAHVGAELEEDIPF